MINGKDHRPNGVALAGQADHAGTEASDLYGDYEQQLASDLTALLKSVPGQGQARDGIAPAGDERIQRLASPEDQGQTGGSTTTAFVPALRPYNDFVDDDSRPPIPSSWRETPAAETDGPARHIKLGLAGFASGLILVVPLVLALTGRLDGLFGASETARRPAPAVATSPAEPAAGPTPPTVATASVTAVPQVSAPRMMEAREPSTAPAATAEAASAAKSEPAVAPALLRDASVNASAPPRDARQDGDRPPAPPLQALAERAPAPPVNPDAELIAAGVRHISDGDVAAARVAFSRAAESGNPEATMALAETFDPNMLAAWGARDVKADAGVARSLYAKALDAGIAKARMRLDALN